MGRRIPEFRARTADVKTLRIFGGVLRGCGREKVQSGEYSEAGKTSDTALDVRAENVRARYSWQSAPANLRDRPRPTPLRVGVCRPEDRSAHQMYSWIFNLPFLLPICVAMSEAQ